jgi:iron complex outermembrane receptor protein
MRYSIYLSSVITLALSPIALAFEQQNLQAIERITVTAPQFFFQNEMEATKAPQQIDIANWLYSIPGANVNRNGPLTGIAQFRGLFGDRVAVQLNNRPIISAGPNAMDTPLSYSGNAMVESITVYQGIVPVSAALNTLGGAIAVNTRQAEIMQSEQLDISGLTQFNYSHNTKGKDIAFMTNIAYQNHALLLHGNQLKGNDYRGHSLIIEPTAYNKSNLGFDYRYEQSDLSVGLSYQHLNTQNTGTPALPMDIDFIRADQAQITLDFNLDHWRLLAQLGYMDNRHAMDNFTLRPIMMASMARKNDTDATTWDFNLQFENDHWLLGLSGYHALHNATITNPNNTLFNISNFNTIMDSNFSGFIQWQNNINEWQLNTGLRFKQTLANAGYVNHSMSDMNNMIAILEQQFNETEKKQKDLAVDWALNAQTSLTEQTTITLGLGIKQRVPSYQERYLWLPMEATGGLADGNTYVGNIDLNKETAYQADVGLNIQQPNIVFRSHIFYQYIDDYIQGTPSNDMTVIAVSNMMSERQPLSFANVDARLYGVDGRALYTVSTHWQLSALFNYVRGKRADMRDNLYRIAPLNGTLSINYLANNWQASVSLKAVSSQNKVSSTNQEQSTAGYSLVNIIANWDLNSSQLTVGIDNLFDRDYRDHLAGYNRVISNDIALFSRLPQQGRTIYASLTYQF